MKLVRFDEVRVDQRFYDPATTQWYVKINGTRAASEHIPSPLSSFVFDHHEMVEVEDQS